MTKKAYKHKWYLENRDRILANRREYKAGNLTEIRRKQREYHKKNKDKQTYINKRRNVRYIAKFGITLDDYNRMLIQQNGLCAICLNPPKRFNLAVDHDHKTGLVRGLLCYRCNYGLGWLGDNWEKIQRVYKYFEAHYNGKQL